MTRFSDEEKSIISMYNTADRVGLIVKIKEAILRPPSKNRHKKASKNEMNRSISLIY